MMLKKIITSPFIFFPLITCIVFWPISFNLFTFKNDALTYYYPVRTLISDALNNYELPLWTPFINMGYPLHADMQSGAWNPIIWLFSFCTHYSLYGFHLEMLTYFSFAGIGFYYLCKEFGLSKYAALITGLAYECSGFMLDSVQFFVCISAACYLPYVFLYFKRLLSKQKINDGLLTSLFLFFIFTGSYPAFFIITFYVLLSYLLFIFFSIKEKWIYLKKITIPLTVVTITFLLLSLPAIISFLNHLSFINRGIKQSLNFVQQNSLLPVSIISLITPFATTAKENWLNTDPLMRSIYIGLIPLLFIIYAVIKKNIRQQKEIRYFFFSAVILFALAMGNHFFLHRWAYYCLPLINTFRHPAIFRLFGIFCLLIVIGHSIDFWLKNTDPDKNKLVKKIIIKLISGICLVATILVFIFRKDIAIPSFEDINFTLNSINSELNFIERFLLQIPFVLVILLFTLLIINHKINIKYLVMLCIIDIFIASQFNIPATIIGAKKVATVTTILNRNKELFPLPILTSIKENSLNTLNDVSGSSLPFIKKIGRNNYYISPGNLKLQEEFYYSPIQKNIFENPVLYFNNPFTSKDSINNLVTNSLQKTDKILVTEDSLKASINIVKLSANTLLCDVQNKVSSTIVFLQNIYPGWEAFLDNKPISIHKINITFMAVNLPQGKHKLFFVYNPKYIKTAWFISMFTLLFIVICLLRQFVIKFFNKH